MSRYAVKKVTKRQAWELGSCSDMENEMIQRGKIAVLSDGSYEVFSMEASEGKGEVASAGDFFTVDGKGFPSPSKRKWFFENHKHLEGDWYLQTAKPLMIWCKNDPQTEEISFIIDTGKLRINPEDPGHYFSAELWGATETAPSDAVIVFYSVGRDEEGKITDVDFNFVDRVYFRNNYKEIEI
ncbi:MAG: hypothetical protein K5779_10580 [Saccharofermentans sp.]|nr:hypothetical protein [Saccharofermentans sp.]